MSDSTPVKPPVSEALLRFQLQMKEGEVRDEELAKKKKDLADKKLFVDTYKYTNELEKILQNEEDIKRSEGANVGVLDEEKIAKIEKENRDYLSNLNDSLVFLDKNLTKLVTAWPGNLILIGANTNGGKSSLTANLMLSTILQKKPSTGKNRRVLVISNEESTFSVYNRLTCLVRNWNYADQQDFSDAQKAVLVDYVGKWARSGVTVIEDDGHGLTTSLEGIKSIFENLFKTETWYDMVILDYIQKVASCKRAQLADHQIMLKTMELLDIVKNTYPAPIIITSQLKTQTQDGNDNEVDFKDRICGRKDILNPCTLGIELVPDRQLLRSRFIIRKSRYKGETVGRSFDMGFQNGKFVPYTEEFKAAVAARRDQEEHHETIGRHVQEPTTSEVPAIETPERTE
jgi:replicative DNA helicase